MKGDDYMQGRLENELKLQQATEKVIASLPSFVNEWYINMKASRKTASTCQDFAIKIRKFFEYINPNTNEISPRDITLEACESFMISCQTKTNENGMIVYTSDSYQQGNWSALNNLLAFMEKRKYISYNYMKDIVRPKNHDLDRIENERVLLTNNDFKKILKTVKQGNSYMNGVLNYRDISILLLFMTTGMRCSALAAINVNDIDYKTNTLSVIDKGSKTHIYPLNEEVVNYINKWIRDREKIASKNTEALFVNHRGDRISSKGISNLVVDTCEQAIGKRLSPHKLRSGFCSILYDKTHDIEFVRRAVGHSNIRTTQRYIKTDGNEREKASQIMGNLLKI